MGRNSVAKTRPSDLAASELFEDLISSEKDKTEVWQSDPQQDIRTSTLLNDTPDDDKTISDRSPVADDPLSQLLPSRAASNFELPSERPSLFEPKIRAGGNERNRTASLDEIAGTIIRAADVASSCLKSIHGYDADDAYCQSLRDRAETMRHDARCVNATFSVIGPSMCGKTSLVLSLVGCPLLPCDLPSMVTTLWTHTEGMAIPRLTISDKLHQLLQVWSKAVIKLDLPDEALLQQVEGYSRVTPLLKLIQRIVALARRKEGKEISLHHLFGDGCGIEIEVEFSIPPGSFPAQLGKEVAISLLDLPGPQPCIRQEYFHQMYEAAIQRYHGIFFVVDASHNSSTDDVEEMLKQLMHKHRECKARNELYIVGNCIDKVPGFYCRDGLETVCRKVLYQQAEKFANIVSDDSRIVPTAARLSLLATYGQKKMSDLIGEKGQRKDAIGKIILEKAQSTTWFSDISQFISGSNKNILRTSTRWQEELKNLHTYGQVNLPEKGVFARLSYEKILNSFVKVWMMLLRNDLTKFFDDYLESIDNGLHSDDFQKPFGLFNTDMTNNVRELFDECLPNKKGRDTFLELLATSTEFNINPRFNVVSGLHHNKPIEVLKKVADVFTKQLNEKLYRVMENISDDVLKRIKKWHRTIAHVVLRQNLNIDAREALLDANIGILEVRNVQAFQGDELYSFCEKFVDDTFSKKKKFMSRSQKYHLTPDFMRNFLEKLASEQADNMMKNWILKPVELHYKEIRSTIAECFEQPLSEPEGDVPFIQNLEETLRSVMNVDFERMSAEDIVTYVRETFKCVDELIEKAEAMNVSTDEER